MTCIEKSPASTSRYTVLSSETTPRLCSSTASVNESCTRTSHVLVPGHTLCELSCLFVLNRRTERCKLITHAIAADRSCLSTLNIKMHQAVATPLMVWLGHASQLLSEAVLEQRRQAHMPSCAKILGIFTCASTSGLSHGQIMEPIAFQCWVDLQRTLACYRAQTAFSRWLASWYQLVTTIVMFAQHMSLLLYTYLPFWLGCMATGSNTSSSLGHSTPPHANLPATLQTMDTANASTKATVHPAPAPHGACSPAGCAGCCYMSGHSTAYTTRACPPTSAHSIPSTSVMTNSFQVLGISAMSSMAANYFWLGDSRLELLPTTMVHEAHTTS